MIFSLVVREDAKSMKLSKDLIAFLLKHNHVLDESKPEVVFFIGGDGTFLRAVHTHLDNIDKITFIGINTGTLGFFCSFENESFEEIVECIETKQYKATDIPLIEAKLKIGNINKTIYAVNEVRLENPFHTLIADIIVNGTHLENYRGNGIVISSSYGSTAYNKSLGGAVIDSSIPLLQITEIAPIRNNFYCSLGSSLILNGDSRIELKGDFRKIVVGYDHEVNECYGCEGSLEIGMSKKIVKLLRKDGYNSINVLSKAFIVDKEE